MNQFPVPPVSIVELFWRDRMEAQGHPLDLKGDVRFNGALYVIDNSPEEDGLRGVEMFVRWMSGGVIRTRRLRYVAKIPMAFRAQLPDNAIVEVIR